MIEEELVSGARESEERFRLVAESAPVMLWMGDATGRCVYLNRPMREFWGVPTEDLSDFDWSGTVHPEDLAILEPPFALGMRTQSGFSVEARYRCADGSYRLLHTTAQPRFSASGEFLGMIGVNTDVTEARNVEAALRRETRLLEILNRTGASLAAELDLGKLVQMVTDAGISLTGAEFGAFFYNVLDENGESYMLYSLSGVPREHFEKFPMPRATEVFRPTFMGTGIVRSDDILTHPDYGRSAPYFGMPKGHLPVRSYLAVPVVSRTGEVIGGLFFGHGQPGRFKEEHETLLGGIAGQAAVAIDNARLFQAVDRENRQRAQVEEQLRALNETLEARVATEIAERRQTESALLQSQKMEAIGQLTGGIAHDFNNLLMAILGSLELLRKRMPADPQMLKLLDNAVEGAQRGSTLTRRMLAFARRQDLRFEPTDLAELVSGMAELLQHSLGPMIDIETLFPTDLPPVMTDPNQLGTALVNILVNARDAMNGAGAITIAAHEESFAGDAELRAGRYVRLAVTDTGEGMDEETLKRAREPFFTTKGVGKGTGLGLSMVHGLAEQSGGRLVLRSRKSEGTTAELWLPVAAELPAEAEAEPAAAEPLEAHGPLVILAVDDDALVLMNTAAMLEDLGHIVIEATSAQEALEQMAANRVDLVVTDHAMPQMSGSELARTLAAEWPEVPVILATGYAELPPGADIALPRLSKPFSQDDLAKAVNAVIAG